MTAEQLNTKIEITEAAIELYLKDNYSIPNLTTKTGKTASEIYALFASKKAVLEFYYPSLVIRYRAMIAEIPDFESYSISEKLSNFIFTLFDMMQEHFSFVEQTYQDMEFSSFSETDFKKEVKLLFKGFFLTDPNIAVSAAFFMGDFFYAFLRSEYLYLVKYWLNDDSEGHERTLALTDKFTGFVEEVVYSKVVDKGFDLFKYAMSNAGFAKNIPVFGSWVSHWFEEENKDKQEEKENE
ncbi:MAG: hypothetical protein WD016_06825 [Balneolaceae bacterium]